MSTEPARLPRVLVVDDGDPVAQLDGLTTGTLLRDVDLPTLVDRSATASLPWAVDIDSVRGLKPDDTAVAFVVRRLGATVVISRRRSVAEKAVELGAIGLVQVLAFDSTGLQRSRPAPGTAEGVGCVVSPGLVLPHLRPAELDCLPRPILAHGLIVRPADAIACLELADGIVLQRDAAGFLALTLGRLPRGEQRPLTSIAVQE